MYAVHVCTQYMYVRVRVCVATCMIDKNRHMGKDINTHVKHTAMRTITPPPPHTNTKQRGARETSDTALHGLQPLQDSWRLSRVRRGASLTWTTNYYSWTSHDSWRLVRRGALHTCILLLIWHTCILLLIWFLTPFPCPKRCIFVLVFHRHFGCLRVISVCQCTRVQTPFPCLKWRMRADMLWLTWRFGLYIHAHVHLHIHNFFDPVLGPFCEWRCSVPL